MDYKIKQLNTVAALAGIIFLSVMPLLTVGIGSGHDLGFHLMRIEAVFCGNALW